MPDTDDWLTNYERDHRNIRCGVIYWPAVPGLVIGVVGLLWSLPVPAALTNISPLLNWGSVFLMAAMVYYFILSIPLAIGMLPFVFGVTLIETRLANAADLLPPVAIALTAASIGGLYAGRYHAAGGIRGVGRDIQMVMIAPAWMLSLLYRRLHIPH